MLSCKTDAENMKSKIQFQVDYERKVSKNPIKLLDTIAEHQFSYQENKYEMSTIADAIKTFVNLKQKENDGLNDYTK